MSLGQVLGFAGMIVGNMIAPGIGGAVGFLAGTLLGNLLDPPKIEGPRLNDLKLQTSEYGRPIPIIYGTMRISGNVIWQTDLQEHKSVEGGKGGPEITNYTYSASFAVMLCEGEIDGIVEVFADGRKVWPTGDSSFDFTLYTGTETQEPDPTMEAEIGVGLVPAHRGYAYVVFDDQMLSEFGNRIPQLEFVVATEPAVRAIAIDSENDDTGSASYTYPVILEWPFNGEPVVSSLSVQSDYVTDPNNAHFYDADTYAIGNPIGTGEGYAWPNYHGTAQRVGIGQHIYADGTSVYLWAREGGTVTAWNYLRDATGAINYCDVAGIPGGRYPVGCATSQDETMLFVFVNSTSISDPPDEWYKIVDGTVADTGTITPPLDQLRYVRGRQSYQLGATGSASMENNGRYLWFFAYNDKTAEIFYIDDANNLADWGGGTLAIPTLPDSSLASPNWNVGCLTLAEEGYCGVASGEGLALLCRLGVHPGKALSEIVSDISSRTTLDLAEYDTTDLTDIVPGYTVPGQMEARNAIYPLAQAYFFDAVEVDGVVTFVKRGGASVVTFDDDDLAARPDSDEAPALLRTVRTQEAELPARVYVEYVNAAFDYQTGTQYDERQVTNSQSQTTITLPISLTDQTAKAIAGAHVWGAYQEREGYTWFSSRKYAKYVPTDVVTVGGMALRVLTTREGANQIIEWTGVVSRAELYDIPVSLIGAGSSSPGQVPPAANVKTQAVLLDIPILSQSDAPFGFYAALGPRADGSWPGATLYKSVDGGSTYGAVKSVGVPSIIGTVTEALGSTSGSPTDVLTVTLSDDDATLSSCNATALAAGANMFALKSGSNWEFCQFQTATLVSPKVYQITVDSRGQRDTNAYQSGHAAGDTFVLLSSVYNVDAPQSELNVALWYKAVTFGHTLASTAAFQFTNTGIATETFYNEELENLDVFVGDNSGSPTVAPRKGLVPAPAVGDGAFEAVLMATNDSGSYWGVPSWAAGGGSPAAGGAIEVRDEGVTLTASASVIDFTGAGVTATYAAGVVTINIPGGGATAGSPSISGTYGSSYTSAVITVNDYGFVTGIYEAGIVHEWPLYKDGAPINTTNTGLNFIGGGVSVVDNAGIGDVTIPLKAPVDATYIVREAHADLTNECILVAGAGITITEGGGSPPASLTIASSVGDGATSQSQEFTTAGAFTCYLPASVTAIRATAIGAGGGGSTRASALGGGGGGSGEQIMSFVMHFDGGSPNAVTGVVGAKGTGASAGGGSAAGNAGGDTIIYCAGATITARGGAGGTSAGVGGAGGGFRGGAGGGSANPGGTGAAGTAEAVTHFGGGGGGGGGSTTGANGGLGAPSGGYDSPTRATAASTQAGGGGGADSPWGLGGVGGGGGVAGTSAAATSYGAGGGGAGGLTGSTAAGGDGADGYVLIEYVAAP